MSLCGVRRAVTRLVLIGIVTSTAGTAALLATPTAAFAESSTTMESEFVAKMNAAREADGLRPYAVYADLTAVARRHSEDMAAKQTLYHNPNLTTDVQNWQAVGENVGEGPTVDDIHQAFMHSPEHRANILDHDFTQVGVGVTVDSNGTIWVTEDFREPMAAATPSTSTPTSPSKPRPVTTVRPASAPHASTPAAAVPHVAWHPRPSLSPRARLLARLSQVRAARPVVRPVDPVAGAFDYVSSLTRLTR